MGEIDIAPILKIKKDVKKMADKHPIEGIMYTALQGLKSMIDVNTIVGDAITSPDG